MGILGDILNLALNGGGQTSPQRGPLQTGGAAFPQRQKYFCKYCGMEYSNVGDLTLNQCPNHPAGKRGFRHELYEGGVKQQYTCKYCGRSYRDLVNLTRNNCMRHPAGKGRCHEPAL
jgi:transposase-like protein